MVNFGNIVDKFGDFVNYDYLILKNIRVIFLCNDFDFKKLLCEDRMVRIFVIIIFIYFLKNWFVIIVYIYFLKN